MKKHSKASLLYIYVLVIILGVVLFPKIMDKINVTNQRTETMTLQVLDKGKINRKKKQTKPHKSTNDYTVETEYYLRIDTTVLNDEEGFQRVCVGKTVWEDINQGDKVKCEVTTKIYKNGTKKLSIETNGIKE